MILPEKSGNMPVITRSSTKRKTTDEVDQKEVRKEHPTTGGVKTPTDETETPEQSENEEQEEEEQEINLYEQLRLKRQRKMAKLAKMLEIDGTFEMVSGRQYCNPEYMNRNIMKQ